MNTAKLFHTVVVMGMGLAAGAACSSTTSPTPAAGGGSSSATSGGSTNDERAASVDANLAALFAGNPSEDDMTAEHVLETSLSADELAHLRRLDWMALTGAAVLADPTLLKAMAAIEQAGGTDPSVTPSSVRIATLHPLTTYTCEADCPTCQQALDTGIHSLQAKLAAHAIGGAVVCGGFGLTGFGGFVCGALVLSLVAKDAAQLTELTACKLGGGGTVTHSFGESSNGIAQANNACTPPPPPPPSDAGIDAFAGWFCCG